MERSRGHVTRFLTVVAVMPAAKSSLGIDGGVLFQILAVEELGLSAGAIGVALGLGVLSIPLQLWAARLTLAVAPRNLRLFLVLVTMGCWGLAALLALTGPGSALGVVALAITVLAEIALSVLYATSNQPLMSRLLSTRARQQVNARGRAVGGVLLVMIVLVFGSVSTAGRAVILAALGVATAATAVMMWHLAAPPEATPLARPAAPSDPLPDVAVPLLLLAGFAAASTWPLFPVYIAEGLGPDVDLGVVGGVQTGSTLAVALLWRSTEDGLLPRATAAVGAILVCTFGFVLMPYVDAPAIAGLVTLILLGLVVAAGTVVLFAILELLHRLASDRTAVRMLTVLDVIESTSLQAGLFLGGLLIALGNRVSLGRIDAYRLYVLALAVGAAGSMLWVRRRVGSGPL